MKKTGKLIVRILIYSSLGVAIVLVLNLFYPSILPLRRPSTTVNYPTGPSDVTRVETTKAAVAVASSVTSNQLVATSVDLREFFSEQEKIIVRLPPADFPELPENIKMDLQARQCLIPQNFHLTEQTPETQFGNVINGEFKAKGTKDWAVLCSSNSQSTLLIYWKGSVQDVEELESEPDLNYLQGSGEGKAVFSRNISYAGTEDVIERFKSDIEAPSELSEAAINHDGIIESFLFKSSSIRYFHKGKWLFVGSGC